MTKGLILFNTRVTYLRRLLFLFFIFLPVIPLFAEVNVDKSVTKSDNWIPKMSPYIISETVTIEKTGFITIHPGTVVKFKEGAQLVVKGALYAKGSPKNPVRFLPEDGESFYEGIRFETKYKNSVEFCIMIRGAIVSEGSKLILNNNYILNSTGVELFHFSNAIIKDNYFYNNTYGVYAEGQSINAVISGNTFHKSRFAIYIKEIKNGKVQVNKNNLMQNQVSVTNYTPANIDCKNNFWAAVTDKAIEKAIFDKKNNRKAGRVIYKPFSRSKLRLFSPPPAFISLVKLYLKLKRPDEQPRKLGISASALGFIPVTPESLRGEAEFGFGGGAEFTLNITGAFLGGLETKIIRVENTDQSVYKYNLDMTQLLLNFYGYIGYKPRIYFIPYIKLGNGIAVFTQEYKYNAGGTDKYPEITYTAHAGAGFEWYPMKYFSLKAEAMYSYTFSGRGNISYPYIGLAGTVYFETPFFLND